MAEKPLLCIACLTKTVDAIPGVQRCAGISTLCTSCFRKRVHVSLCTGRDCRQGKNARHCFDEHRGNVAQLVPHMWCSQSGGYRRVDEFPSPNAHLCNVCCKKPMEVSHVNAEKKEVHGDGGGGGGDGDDHSKSRRRRQDNNSAATMASGGTCSKKNRTGDGAGGGAGGGAGAGADDSDGAEPQAQFQETQLYSVEDLQGNNPYDAVLKNGAILDYMDEKGAVGFAFKASSCGDFREARKVCKNWMVFDLKEDPTTIKNVELVLRAQTLPCGATRVPCVDPDVSVFWGEGPTADFDGAPVIAEAFKHRTKEIKISEVATVVESQSVSDTRLCHMSVTEREIDFWDSKTQKTTLYARKLPIKKPSAALLLLNWSVWSWALGLEQALQKLGFRAEKPRNGVGDGIVEPWFYLSGPYSFFGCHLEDWALGSCNYLSVGSEYVIWYILPRSEFSRFLGFILAELGFKDAQGPEKKKIAQVFESRRCLVDPFMLLRKGFKVTRHVQKAGEYVALAPGALHWGINLGVGSKAAFNWVSADHERWKRAAQDIDDAYAAHGIDETLRNEKTTFKWVGK